MTKKFDLSPRDEMDRRHQEADRFFRALFDADERPIFVSDDATLDDVFVGDEERLSDRCEAHYGVRLRPSDFGIPLWQLLDHLESRMRS